MHCSLEETKRASSLQPLKEKANGTSAIRLFLEFTCSDLTLARFQVLSLVAVTVATATTSVPTTKGTSVFARFRLIDFQVTTHPFSTIKCLNGSRFLSLCTHFHKSKAAHTPSFTVGG